MWTAAPAVTPESGERAGLRDSFGQGARPDVETVCHYFRPDRAGCLECACVGTGSSRRQLDSLPDAHEDEQDRGPGPDLGDYLGLPINSAARLFADSWDASRLTLQEHQCRVHVAPYIYHGPLNLRIWEEKDPETQRVIAIKNYISTYEQTRTIWMDGRRIPRRLRRTPSWASRPADGKATS